MKPWAAPAVHTCIVYKQVTTGMGMRASFLVLLLGFFLGSGYAQACRAPGSPCPFMQAEQIDVRHSSPSPASQNTLMVKACCCVPAQAAAVRLTFARAPLPSDPYAPSFYHSIYPSLPDPPPKAVPV